MSKFCFECGTRIDDGAVFCTNCGAPQEVTIPVTPVAEPVEKTPEKPQFAQPVYEQPAEPAPVASPAPPARRTKKSRKGLVVFLVLLGLVAMFLVGLVVGAIAGAGAMYIINDHKIPEEQEQPPVVASQYTDPIDDYIDILINGNYEKIQGMAPEKYWEMTEPYETYDPITKDYIWIEDELAYRKEYAQYWHEWVADEYGDDVQVRYEITNEQELSLKKLTLIAQALQKYYQVNPTAVEEGRVLDLEIQVIGSQNVFADEVSGTVIKVDGTWYWIYTYEWSSEEIFAYFPVFEMVA